ncbi:Type IV conjugative transfer system protein TraE domain-containing protein [Desulfonema limicola]|uniref:Type IV conjugative transfer system protein TraE domain-containing protein n=1 Tax=Desulfonema limicola TaxID=45656 RepID=A0A975GJR1_9BACT|nr:TraE/TraK family type IV conjugative transfer system protein [Desulfonema limicola]QTA83864.1 Type IV conjugative transfer system protein TraE domain-containing protein [Desulfonema limicola]
MVTWNSVERINRLFAGIIIVMALGMAVMGMAFYKYIGWQKVVLVPPAITDKIEIAGDTNSADYVRVMVKYIGQEIMEYTPNDIGQRINTVLFYVPPRYHDRVKKSLENLRQDVLQSGLNQMFRLHEMRVRENGEAYLMGNIERYVEGRPVWSNVAKLRINFSLKNGRFSILGFKMKVGPFKAVVKDQIYTGFEENQGEQ